MAQDLKATRVNQEPWCLAGLQDIWVLRGGGSPKRGARVPLRGLQGNPACSGPATCYLHCIRRLARGHRCTRSVLACGAHFYKPQRLQSSLSDYRGRAAVGTI